jgi:hypothetical protein
MKKLLPVLLFSFVFFNSWTLYSQVNFSVNGGVEIPAGNFSNAVNNGYGVSASLGWSLPIAPVEIDVTAGYDNWPYKTQYSLSNSGLHEFDSGTKLYSIPVTIGPKLFINIPGIGFEPYIGIDVGVVSSNSTAAGVSSSTDFVYSPEVGFRYNLPLNVIAIDINLREYNYTNTSGGTSQTTSWYGISGGLVISL